MISVRLYKRRKRLCQVTTLWCSAVVVAMIALLGTWHAGRAGSGKPLAAPAMDLGEPDMTHGAVASLPVNGDGVVDTPNVVFRLIPALAHEAADAVHRGDAELAFQQFQRWIASGEALHSGPFWVFWAVVGAGIVALGCWSLVNQLVMWRHGMHLPKATGADESVRADDANDLPQE